MYNWSSCIFVIFVLPRRESIAAAREINTHTHTGGARERVEREGRGGTGTEIWTRGTSPRAGFRMPRPGARMPWPGFRMPRPEFRMPRPEFRMSRSGFRMPRPNCFRMPRLGFECPGQDSNASARIRMFRLGFRVTPRPGARMPRPGARMLRPGARMSRPGFRMLRLD